MEWYRTNLCGIEKPEYPSTGYVRNLIRYNIRFFFFFQSCLLQASYIYTTFISKNSYEVTLRSVLEEDGISLGWELIPWTVHPKTALFEEMSAFLGFFVQPK